MTNKQIWKITRCTGIILFIIAGALAGYSGGFRAIIAVIIGQIGLILWTLGHPINDIL